jgi:hypothetical protein
MSDKETDSDNDSDYNVRRVVLSDGTHDSLGGGRIMEVKEEYGGYYPRDIPSKGIVEDVSLNDLFDCCKKFGKQFKEERGE